jgi:hypothetical protein
VPLGLGVVRVEVVWVGDGGALDVELIDVRCG